MLVRPYVYPFFVLPRPYLFYKVEDVFRAGSEVVIPASEWPTAKDDLEMDLVQMLKDQASNVRNTTTKQ